MLIGLRNFIMHVKPALGDDPHPGKRLVDTLAQRGLALRNNDSGGISWFDQLMTPRIAEWAHAAALDMINAIFDLVPITSFDPLQHYRQLFRDHPHL